MRRQRSTITAIYTLLAFAAHACTGGKSDGGSDNGSGGSSGDGDSNGGGNDSRK